MAFAIILFSTSFFPTRINLAGAIVIYSYRYLIDKQLIRFLLVAFIALSMHYSSIIIVPFYFLMNYNLSALTSYIIFLFTFVAGDFQLPIINFIANKFSFLGPTIITRLKLYTSFIPKQQNDKSAFLGALLFFIFIVIFLWVKKRYTNRNDISAVQIRTINVFYNSFIIYFAINTVFKDSMQEFARTANFFLPGYPILLSYVFIDKRITKESKPLIYIVFVLYMVYKFNSNLGFYPSLHFPYKSVLH
ncbi:hypothetical protein A9P82_05925 [Arachidicoccus ginsenosidimutans]|nr:hypothetical protein A9P82_05925 [Arachidicoccus sp. BS20]